MTVENFRRLSLASHDGQHLASVSAGREDDRDGVLATVHFSVTIPGTSIVGKSREAKLQLLASAIQQRALELAQAGARLQENA